MSQARMTLPCTIGEHAGYAVGRLQAAADVAFPSPVSRWLPPARAARASALQPSGAPVRRPHGQYRLPDQAQPVFGPTQQLDFGAGLGVLVAEGNASGEPETMHEAEDDWFGLVLLDDWSARDVQAWESQPLALLQAPAFATTVSPWVVTREALEPFRVPAPRPAGEPPLPAHLDSPANRLAGGLDIQLEVRLQGATMRDRGEEAVPLSRIGVRDAAGWTVAQMIVQHTTGGGRLRPGDLLGTGALSGPAAGQAGCLLAFAAMGGVLPGDAPRRGFLLDGDRVVIRGWCERRGARRIGFGSCEAWVEPALPWPPATA
jgi:fumarylacetoacetase